MNLRMVGAALGAAGCVAAALAQAQAPAAQGAALSDPMRPPSVAALGNVQDEAPAGRQLQSVLLSGGRKLAIIDGNVVPLGGMIGEARVVRISETTATLVTGNETEVLKLYPAVDKQPVKRTAPRAHSTAPGLPRVGGSR